MASQNVILNPEPEQVTKAQQRAVSMANDLADTISGVDNTDQAFVRDMLPNEDLQSGDDNSWDGNDREWVQSGLTADQNNETYQIDSNERAQNKVYVFYGLANVSSDPLTAEVSFDDGTDARFFRVNTEVLEVTEVSDYVLFDKAVVYGNTENGDINQWPDGSGSDNVIYLAKVAEPIGETISTRESPRRRLASGSGRGR